MYKKLWGGGGEEKEGEGGLGVRKRFCVLSQS